MYLFPLSWSAEGAQPTLGEPALLASSGVALLPSYPAFMWKQTTRYSFHHASFVAEFHISLACEVQIHAVWFILDSLIGLLVCLCVQIGTISLRNEEYESAPI